MLGNFLQLLGEICLNRIHLYQKKVDFASFSRSYVQKWVDGICDKGAAIWLEMRVGEGLIEGLISAGQTKFSQCLWFVLLIE